MKGGENMEEVTKALETVTINYAKAIHEQILELLDCRTESYGDYTHDWASITRQINMLGYIASATARAESHQHKLDERNQEDSRIFKDYLVEEMKQIALSYAKLVNKTLISKDDVVLQGTDQDWGSVASQIKMLGYLVINIDRAEGFLEKIPETTNED